MHAKQYRRKSGGVASLPNSLHAFFRTMLQSLDKCFLMPVSTWAQAGTAYRLPISCMGVGMKGLTLQLLHSLQ